MKVSKQQLRRIIKEEKARLHEVVHYNVGDLEPAIKEVMSILYVMDPEEMRAEIYALIDKLEDMARLG